MYYLHYQYWNMQVIVKKSWQRLSRPPLESKLQFRLQRLGRRPSLGSNEQISYICICIELLNTSVSLVKFRDSIKAKASQNGVCLEPRGSALAVIKMEFKPIEGGYWDIPNLFKRLWRNAYFQLALYSVLTCLHSMLSQSTPYLRLNYLKTYCSSSDSCGWANAIIILVWWCEGYFIYDCIKLPWFIHFLFA